MFEKLKVMFSTKKTKKTAKPIKKLKKKKVKRSKKSSRYNKIIMLLNCWQIIFPFMVFKISIKFTVIINLAFRLF